MQRICLELEVYRDLSSNVLNFLSLKVFFCGRSDYFRTLLDGHFSASTSPGKQLFSPSIPEVYLNDVSPDVFAAVVAFIYQDDALVSAKLTFSGADTGGGGWGRSPSIWGVWWGFPRKKIEISGSEKCILVDPGDGFAMDKKQKTPHV